MMTDAEPLFNNALMRLLDGWGTILSFRLVVEAGLPAAAAHYSEMTRAIVRGELPASDIFQGVSLPPEAFDWLVRILTDHTTNTAINSVNAASFVFMHSLLDALALDLCRISVLKDPEGWADRVKTRKISLEQVLRTATSGEVLRGVLEKYLERLARESLLTKIDLVFRACAPASGTRSCLDGSVYIFDGGRVERLDQLRHEILHGDALGGPIQNAFDDLRYLMDTAVHLALMAANRYSLQISNARARDWATKEGLPTREN